MPVTVECVGTAAPVLVHLAVVVVEFSAAMALMNQTHILIVTIARRRAICPAQVFLGTVESSVMAMQRVQINGMNCFPYANLSRTQTNQMRMN